MEGRLASIQTRIDELRARISPMSQQQEQDVNVILTIQQDITAAEGEMESARTNLKTAREELVALEETARQAGVAPGVLRPPPQ
jgi:chromosome segregation ATPase